LKFLAIGYFYSDTLPACIGNLTQLEELDICWDGYRLPVRKATVLPAIGQLTKLKSLTFSGGYLPIELPNELGNLTSLERLRIFNLKFDSLPESLGNLVNLEDAMLCGDMKTLPSSFGNWKKMESIYMAGNVFQSIPQCVFEMKALTSLDVSNNDLKDINDKIALLDKLEELWLSGNDFLNHIPDEICELNKLHTLDLENTIAIETSNAELDKESGKLTWKLTLAPGESKVIKLSYSIKSPKWRHIDGDRHVRRAKAKF
jgi:Leucine-rich repeat (LRR) protein